VLREKKKRGREKINKRRNKGRKRKGRRNEKNRTGDGLVAPTSSMCRKGFVALNNEGNRGNDRQGKDQMGRKQKA